MNIRSSILGVWLITASNLAAQIPPAPPPKPAPTPPVTQEAGRLHPLAATLGMEIRSSDKKALGRLANLIVDSADGSLDYVMVSQSGLLGDGQDKFLVPYESLQLFQKDIADSDEFHATTTLTAERILSAPKFVEAQPIGPETERAIREAAGLPPVSTQPRTADSQLTAANKFRNAEVLGATKEKLGQLEELILDPRAGIVAYTVLATAKTLGLDEKRYTLPFELTRVRVEPENKIVLDSDLTKERLIKAPEYDPKDPKRMWDNSFVLELFNFYKLVPYVLRVKPTPAPNEPPVEKPKDKK